MEKSSRFEGKLFSIGGKEVLIKAVIQTIPCYSMSGFKIPKKLLNEINQMAARFWWGEGEKDRKIHWVGVNQSVLAAWGSVT